MGHDITQTLKGLVWGLIAHEAIITMLASCATRAVVVPQGASKEVRHRDTVVVRDSVRLSTTTIVREADSATMASFGVSMARAERAWLVRERSDRTATVHTAAVSRRDSIVHDTVAVAYPSGGNAGGGAAAWPVAAMAIAAALSAATALAAAIRLRTKT